jgi:hypothetical protein
MTLTAKQKRYVRHRAAGLGQGRAAIESGYSPKGAKVTASRMERDPKIAGAIREARQAGRAEPGGPREYLHPEDYLAAVVSGAEPPDPVRVGAARALLPYCEERVRPTKSAASPKALRARGARAVEQDLLDRWAVRERKVRGRMGRA